MWLILLLSLVNLLKATTQSTKVIPVFLHKDDKGSRALLLSPDAPSFDPLVYSGFRYHGPRFCLSPVPSALTPAALYAQRKILVDKRIDHRYSVEPCQAGQVSQGGYQCMGLMGFVQRASRCGCMRNTEWMQPIHYWYSPDTQIHAYSRDINLGTRLNQNYKYKGILAFTLPCNI